jgi:hypothetical protein
MANKQELKQIQQVQALEQEQLVGYWCKKRGITRKALENHPQIDDVMLLIKWRDLMEDKLNRSEQAVFGAYWGYTYTKRKALKIKNLKKLEQITITATERHNQQIQHKQAQREKIKALRQNPYEKSSAYTTAKSEDSACSAPWE